MRDQIIEWEDLLDLVAEGRAALAEPDNRRPRACVEVLPKIVDALERVALYKVEIIAIKGELAAVVSSLRDAVTKAQASEFSVAARSLDVKKALNLVPPLLDRIDRLIYGVP